MIYTYSSYSVVPDTRCGRNIDGVLLTLGNVFCEDEMDHPKDWTFCYHSTGDAFFFISDKMFKVFGAKAMYTQLNPCSES